VIQIECSGCGSKLNAKPELAGQTRKCPKCGTPITIPQSVAEQPEPAAEQPQADTPPDGLGEHPPERLERAHRFLVCDRARLIATWENNGQGWLLKINSGLLPAARHQDKLPVEGDFRLIELKLESTPQGHRLIGLASYKLTRRYALVNLARGDDAILKAVVGPAGLSREQKNVVRQALREHFMAAVWQNAENVLDFLKSTDFHTPGVG
jgi:hypothetical protein